MNFLLISLFLISSIHAQLLPIQSQAPTKPKLGPWKCDLAQDGSGLPQHPYCCDENTISRRYQDGRILGVTDCTAVPSDQDVQCAHAADVWCCYTLKSDTQSQSQNQGPDEWICTSVAQWRP